MKRIACIYNDSSGSAADTKQIEQVFNNVGLRVDFLAIKTGEHDLLKKLTSQAYSCVVAAGGDGTVRLTAQLAKQAKLTLGLLPLGTLNHFAKDAGLPLELEKAAQVIAEGRALPVDYCTVNDHVFMNNASIGLYPATVTQREKAEDRWGKWPAALAASVGALSTNKNLACTITTPKGSTNYRSPLIFIGNNTYHVDRAGLGARDRLTGGNMFLYVVRATRRWRLTLVGIMSLFGVRLRKADVIQQTSGPITVKAAQQSISLALDGEVFTMDFPLMFTMQAGQLDVLCKMSR